MLTLQGQSALVTGASKGLGEAVARALAEHGAAVMLVARNEAAVNNVAASIRAAGGRAQAMACDVADYDAVERALAQAVIAFGHPDILINNAGVIEPIGALASSDPALWAKNISINLIGAYNAVRAVLPGMLARGAGRVINLSSGAAFHPQAGRIAYCAGKAGLAMLTSGLALETSDAGLRVFGLSPGMIDTDMQASIRASGIGPTSQIPKADLRPVAHAVKGVLYLCDKASDDLSGREVALRDEAFRTRIGLL